MKPWKKVLGYVLAGGLLLAAFGLLLSAIDRVPGKAIRQASPLSSLRTVGGCIQQYANQHGGQYPADLSFLNSPGYELDAKVLAATETMVYFPPTDAAPDPHAILLLLNFEDSILSFQADGNTTVLKNKK